MATARALRRWLPAPLAHVGASVPLYKVVDGTFADIIVCCDIRQRKKAPTKPTLDHTIPSLFLSGTAAGISSEISPVQIFVIMEEQK